MVASGGRRPLHVEISSTPRQRSRGTSHMSFGLTEQAGDCSILDDAVPDSGPRCMSFFHPHTAKKASRSGYRTRQSK
jgi:hypothetical protein